MSITPAFAQTVRAPHASDWALSHGIASLTTAQVADLIGAPASQVSQRLAAPKQRGEWITPARGLWIPVPPQFRAWGGPPAAQFIAAFMTHLGVAYYVGWLAAAALYGAAHHAPQVTHVAVDRLIRDRHIGRATVRFHTRNHIDAAPTEQRTADSGTYLISSPEVTAFDVATNIAISGGLGNAATVIVDLAQEAGLDDTLLTRIAALYPESTARRLGWMIETHTDHRLDNLAQHVAQGSTNPARLHPTHSLTGAINHRWRLRLNSPVEPE